MKGLYKRRRKWWFAFTYRGVRHRLSLGVEHEADAINQAMKILANPAPFISGREFAEELMEEFLSLKAARGVSSAWIEEERLRIGAFFRSQRVRHPSEIDRGRVVRWADSHWQRNPETGNAYLSTVARFTRWLHDHGHLAVDPCPGVPRMKVRTRARSRFLSRDECRRLLAATDDRDLKTAIFLGLHAGLRKGEVLAAAPHWLDLPGRLLHVQASADWQPKDRDNRTIPITAEFAEFLAAAPVPGPYLAWPDKRGTGRYRFDFRKPFSRALAAAGIDCTFHDLRRTFASLHVSAGTSIYKVAKWLGDGVVVVENHYGHLTPADDEINRAWG